MKNDHEIRASFRRARRDLVTFGQKLEPDARAVIDQLIAHLDVAEPFYLPLAAELFEYDDIEPDFAAQMRLPFPTVAILSESPILNDAGDVMYTSDRITIAAELAAEQQTARIEQQTGHPLYPPMLIGSAWIPSPDIKRPPGALAGAGGTWFAFPAMCYAHMRRDGGRPVMYSMPGSIADPRSPEAGLHEFKDDVRSAINLMAILALANVSHDRAEPPAKLMARKRGRDPQTLPDYCVVTVDGERWVGERSQGGATGRGVRSHKRRGHIRRLAPDRHIWVRATMVHGSTPGEVEQIYRTRG